MYGGFACRLWQVDFEVHMPLKTLPYPMVVVEEEQGKPSYRLDGYNRRERGGQLSVTLQGHGKFRQGRHYYDLTPGMAFLHAHADPEISYLYPPDGTETWRFLWISFGGRMSVPMIRDINRRYGYLFRLPLDRGIVRQLQKYRNCRGALQLLTPLAAGKLVMDLFAELGNTYEKQSIQTPQSILVRRTQEYIVENLHRAGSVNAIAAELKVSREHLSRSFREQTGMNISEYIGRRRINLALDLLLQTNLSCKEIAERTGFSDSSSFSRSFKSLVGVTPGLVRESGCRPDV